MSHKKGYIVVDSGTNALLSGQMNIMSQEEANLFAQTLSVSASAVELVGLSEPWNPTVDPAQNWVYDPVTKVLNIETP